MCFLRHYLSDTATWNFLCYAMVSLVFITSSHSIVVFIVVCFQARATHDARCLQYRVVQVNKKTRGQDSLKGYPLFRGET